MSMHVHPVKRFLTAIRSSPAIFRRFSASSPSAMGSHAGERRLKADSVCVIGAGPSGLAAAKSLLAEQTFSNITIVEQSSTVGGIWNYVPCPDSTPSDLNIPQTNPHAGHDEPIWNNDKALDTGEPTFMTPLYDRLETNIPRELMGFTDLKWPEDCQLFPEHERVLKYIGDFAKDVRHLIRFRTQVLDVKLQSDETWTVKMQEVTPSKDGKITEESFDAVIVASGHFNVPYIPDVAGIKEWNSAYPRSISHSKFYRLPEDFTDKKVIVVGNSASGIDISAQIREVCKKPLLLSQKSESFLVNEASSSKIDKPPIVEYIVKDRSVRFQDGTIESDVDSILYCTGYFYSMPFLELLDPPVITTGDRVERLYQHIFYQPNPSLSFLVLNQKVIPFPVAEAQSAVIARTLSGRLTLPSEDEMKQWEDDMVREVGDERKFHVLSFPKDADYINMLHDWALSADQLPHEYYLRKNISVKTSFIKGRRPPHWGPQEYWIRERFPVIKKAFNDCGEDRHTKKTIVDVGFDYFAWEKQRE